MVRFYSEELLAHRSTSKLEEPPWLAVRGYLFIIFAVITISGGRATVLNTRYYSRSQINPYPANVEYRVNF
jgi:hypothetical protein